MVIASLKQPERILYYLGAGASAKALPLARSIWDDTTKNEMMPIGGIEIAYPKVRGLAFELEHFLRNNVSDCDENDIEIIKSECKELAKKADEFGDVDTYAKYLQLMDSAGEELDKLKCTLSKYFTIKQLICDAIDKRYLPWLISIMNRKEFPDNIKVLSWNYDSQIQIAAQQLGDDEDLVTQHELLTYRFSMIEAYPNLDFQSSQRKPSLIHLNGRAGFSAWRNGYQSAFQASNCSSNNRVVSFLKERELSSGLHFAWENSDYHKNLMQKVIDMIRETTIVVVIGYSFPFFNREVDKEIFMKLRVDGKLKKIYFQDPILDGQQLKAQFGLDDNFPIVHIKQTDNFHVPFEY